LRQFVTPQIDTVRDPLLILDENLKVVTASRSFYRFFQVKPKDTAGQFIYDIGNRQWNIPALRELLEKVLPQKESFDDYEVDHFFLEIGHRTMLLNARRVPSPPEKSQLILLAMEDITERKQAQKELKISEERFRRAFATSHDATLLIDKVEGRLLVSNESATKLMGYSLEEFLQMRLWDIGAVKDPLGFQDVLRKLEIEGVVYFDDVAIKTKGRSTIDSEIFLVDKAAAIQCNIRDITNRKAIAEKLRESETEFKAIFDDAQDGILIVDLFTKQFFMFSECSLA
jgi:PAS domain S-box-containing protein